MKKLLIGSAVLAALLIKENIAVNAAIEQNETTPKIAVTDKKEKPKDQSDNSLAGHYDQETNFITWEIRLNPKKEKYTGDLKLENLIPLSIIGYSVGGIRYVIYIFIMIMIIHAIEAYVLNPKFMASKTELPIFYTFLVLLVAEHFWGTWGLIVGVPIFTFLLDVLGIKSAKKSKKKANK